MFYTNIKVSRTDLKKVLQSMITVDGFPMLQKMEKNHNQILLQS